MPYYSRDPKRDHNLDNHPYAVQPLQELHPGQVPPKDCREDVRSEPHPTPGVLGVGGLGFRVWFRVYGLGIYRDM